MKTVVVRNSKPTDAARLGALGVAAVHEAYGRSGLMKPYLRAVWQGGEATGTADDDGVVVVRRKDVAEAIARGDKRKADEDGKRKQLAARFGLDMYNRREPLKKPARVYVDELPED